MKIAVKQSRKVAPPVQRINKPKKLIAFGWYGGKFSHLDWLLPQLPDCVHYCEPFAGSGAVLLNKIPSPVETYNDIDGEVVNFFKVLRIDVALQKLPEHKIDNYIFITTDTIELDVAEYAKGVYEKIGIEFTILDCIGFIRHFLHFFHRQKNTFLNIYQSMVLAESTSAVSQPLKEAFLALRRAAEGDRR
ncbi:MAG: DNA adenine methylase [Prevotellaceae bacterium]|nr:DNA adenine methylase [Prevotellaceae bacterium]